MDGFAELVCSNSLKSDSLTGASGVLKAELRKLDSLLIRCADKTSVPAGGALAVDRYAFPTALRRSLKISESENGVPRCGQSRGRNKYNRNRTFDGRAVSRGD